MTLTKDLGNIAVLGMGLSLVENSFPSSSYRKKKKKKKVIPNAFETLVGLSLIGASSSMVNSW